MMKRKLIHNLSANSLQLVINQVFGLVIFYVMSTGLDKNSFGQINLALAILLAAFNILSFGIDQVIIKKVASGTDPRLMLSLYLGHVLLTGLLFYGLLLAGKPLFAASGGNYTILLLIGIGKLMIYFSMPFKQVSIGMERFNLLAYMSVVSNILRALLLLAATLMHQITLHNIILIFIIGDSAEMLFCLYLFINSTKIAVELKWLKTDYFRLIRESLPQVGVVMITSALARFDWIFIGFFLSAVKLAEYSFAYKVFEISTLPLLAIAPLLIPRFAQLFKNNTYQVEDLKFLVRGEAIVACFVGLLLNICWAQVIDWATNGKYGAINSTTTFILSLCMPLLYVNNFLWTIYFSQHRLKMILTAFIITLVVNVAGDLVLIPVYKNEGAAVAFLLATLAQTLFFIYKNEIPLLNKAFYSTLICMACALTSGFGALYLFPQNWMTIPTAILIYLILLLSTAQIRLQDAQRLRQFAGL